MTQNYDQITASKDAELVPRTLPVKNVQELNETHPLLCLYVDKGDRRVPVQSTSPIGLSYICSLGKFTSLQDRVTTNISVEEAEDVQSTDPKKNHHTNTRERWSDVAW